MGITLEKILPADSDRATLVLTNGDEVLVEPSLETLTGHLDLEAAVTVHYHPTLMMAEKDWPQIQKLLVGLNFDNSRIENLLQLDFATVAELPSRVLAHSLGFGSDGKPLNNTLYLSHPVDFQGPWYTRSQSHYALLNDGPDVWKIWVNLNLSRVDKIESGHLPGHYL